MRSIGITIMHDTAAGTTPDSYAQLTQSTRPCLGETGRASQAGPGFIDFAVRDTKPHGFIGKHRAKLAPSSIEHGFCHTSFGKFGRRDVPHRNQAGLLDNGGRDFVCPVFALVGDLRMDVLDALGFVRPLCHGQGIFMSPGQILAGVFDAIRTGNQVFQTKINPDFSGTVRRRWQCNLALQIDIPMPTGILRKAASFQGALDGSRLPEAEMLAFQAQDSCTEFDGTSLERNPAQRPLLASPAQPDFVKLPALLDVFIADLTERIGMQAELVTNRFSRRHTSRLVSLQKFHTRFTAHAMRCRCFSVVASFTR
jgi:hypothetical protein